VEKDKRASLAFSTTRTFSPKTLMMTLVKNQNSFLGIIGTQVNISGELLAVTSLCFNNTSKNLKYFYFFILN
jgi:hypothetical protein